MGCVEVDTVHHRAEFLLSRSEDGAVDILRQLTAFDHYFVGIVIHTLWLREIFCRFNGQCELSVEISHLCRVVRLVNIECDRLFRESFHCIEDVVAVDGKRVIGITLRQFNWC